MEPNNEEEEGLNQFEIEKDSNKQDENMLKKKMFFKMPNYYRWSPFRNQKQEIDEFKRKVSLEVTRNMMRRKNGYHS